MIVATAGHVDHGKTSLVKALTAVDTDRLAEEKRRGMSIDLGFAYADLGAAEPVGFIDVPGHERFMRNMLAGVAGIDVALLVVAADDGPMPQTLEHLAVLGLLAVPECVVALTKIDRVAPARLAQARAEVAALLATTAWPQAPVWALDTPSGRGVAALREALGRLALGHSARPVEGHFRMSLDRSFALAGAGRVVTGAVLSGQVRVGDEVCLAPRGSLARVRGIHTMGLPATLARAGQRSALNLTGVDLHRAEPQRGDWLLAPPAHAPTERLAVRLEVLASEPRPLASRASLLLHLGASAVAVRVSLLFGPAIAAGSAGLAQLRLDKPVSAFRGDRFILRDAAARRVIGGGVVLDPFAPPRGGLRPQRLAELAAWGQPDAAAALSALLVEAPHGLALNRFALAWNLAPPAAAALQHLPGVVVLATPAGPLAQSAGHWQGWCARLRQALADWHSRQADSSGPGEGELRQLLQLRCQPDLLRALLAQALASGEVCRDGLCLRLASHRAVLGQADQALLDRVHAALGDTGLRPPIAGDLAAQLGLPVATLQAFVQRAARLGLLLRIAPNRCYLPQTLPGLVALAQTLAAESADGGFDAAAYRDRSGIGRNLTVQVLEFLDRAGLTRFDGQRHWPSVAAMPPLTAAAEPPCCAEPPC